MHVCIKWYWNKIWAFKYWWCCVKGNQIYCGKKRKDITKEEKKYKAFFQGKTSKSFYYWKTCSWYNWTLQITKTHRINKKLGYNQDDIIVREETSIAEKIIKLFPHENIVLNKKFNKGKPNIWFKNYNIIYEVDEGNHEIYDLSAEKKKDMFKKHNFKIFLCNPNDPNFDLFKFLGEINWYILKLLKKSGK